MFSILKMVVQPKMRYHGNQFFKNSSLDLFAILVKDVSFILVKTDSRYTITTRDIVFLLNLTIFSIFGAFSKIYCNYLNIEVR